MESWFLRNALEVGEEESALCLEGIMPGPECWFWAVPRFEKELWSDEGETRNEEERVGRPVWREE